jgi:hypothetical protein
LIKSVCRVSTIEPHREIALKDEYLSARLDQFDRTSTVQTKL